MSTLGGRLGLAAVRRFAGQGGAGERLAVYHADTCAVDGVQVTTGCRPEDGSLRVVDQGRHALALVSPPTGEGVIVSLREAALAIAWEYRSVSEALDRDRHDLSAAMLEARERQRQEVLDAVLQKLWTLDDETLLTFGPVVLDVNSLPG